MVLGTTRGKPGNPRDYDLLQDAWKGNGPFELSPERGRYALIYSVLENRSYTFSPYLAVFTSPDVADIHNSYVSLFPPGLSYLTMPGFLIGRIYGLEQVGTFAVIALFAVANMILIYLIARQLGAHPAASFIASLIFLFATPAFSYAATLYQHHVTTFLLLVSILLLSGKNHWLKLFLIWFLAAAAVVIDSPNALFFIPIGVYGLLKFGNLSKSDSTYRLNFHPWYILTFVSIVLPISFLLYFNKQSYGNPLQLGGGVPRATEVTLTPDEASGKISATSTKVEDTTKNKKEPVKFFRTRNAMNGLYELFLSMDRGTIFFAPVILIGLLGIAAAQKKRTYLSSLILSTIMSIIVLYALWGDPYGGWAFGSRYLIPAYALFAPYLALALTRYRRDIFVFLLFVISATYSVAVNTIGALTSNANPPHKELSAMWKNYGYAPPEGILNNYQQLLHGQSKSFVYNTYFHSLVSVQHYAYIIAGTIGALILICLIWLITAKKTETKNDN